jgi:tyrosyl-tRNA synthetase
MFTELPITEIARLEALAGAEINSAKEILATQATHLCHGETAAAEAAATAASAFAGRAGSAALAEGSDTDEAKGVRLPTYRLEHAAVPVIDVLVALGMAASKSDARRLIEQGGVKLNDRPVPDPTIRVTAADLEFGGTARIRVGKKRHGLITG